MQNTECGPLQKVIQQFIINSAFNAPDGNQINLFAKTLKFKTEVKT